MYKVHAHRQVQFGTTAGPDHHAHRNNGLQFVRAIAGRCISATVGVQPCCEIFCNNPKKITLQGVAIKRILFSLVVKSLVFSNVAHNP